jgi:DNA-binding PadR family transcriptional regulator
MASTQPNIDLRALAESLRSNISKLGGFSPQQVRQDASLSEEALQRRILLALGEGQLTGAEILAELQSNATTARAITAADVYPVLEKLQDLGLVSSSIKADRRTFSLTKDGASAASAFEPQAEPSDTEQPAFGWVPNWIDLRGKLAKSAGRLAKVTAEASQYGTKEQQDLAAEAIDEATKKIHSILGSS